MTYTSSSSPEIPVASSSESKDRFSFKHATHDDVLEDLSSRFILNLPDEELASLERVCFQIEQAHWFYEDFIREENPKFPSLPLKKFSAMLFRACPLLHQWSHDHEQAFNTFMQYKTRVPVCGAIMLNESWEKCVLVKGWKSSSGWGFPKGKINEDEPEHVCATREVLEETGYNIANQIKQEDVIQMSIKEQKISLYIVPGVPEDFEFKTRTRKEISRIEWFKLTDLPTWKRNKAAPGKFYLISPFIGPLKAFINERKPTGIGRKLPKPSNIPLQGILKDGSTSPQPYLESQSHAQESSSQSSSQDNGDPQTPSPQYSEPSVRAGIERPAIADPKTPPDVQSVDPLARLLSSLSLSTEAKLGNRENSVQVPALLSKSSSPLPTTTTPVPMSSPSISVVDRSSAPTSYSKRTTNPTSSAGNSVLSEKHPSVSSLPLNRPFATPSQNPPNDTQETSTSQYLLPASLSSPSNCSISAESSVHSSGSWNLSSRRTSSTADISPYLLQPPEIPTSGKRLKQLALLETIADESTRMTPLLAKQQVHSLQQSNTYSVTSSTPSSGPTSIPPNNMNVIYSSSSGTIGVALPSAPYPQLSLPPISDDSFRLQPRVGPHQGTSALPYFTPHMGDVPRSQVTTVAGPVYMPGPPVGVLSSQRQLEGYHFPLPVPQQALNYHPFQHTGLPQGVPSHLQVFPPHSVPSSQPGSASLSGFDLAIPPHPSQTSSSLLSILNGGRAYDANIFGGR